MSDCTPSINSLVEEASHILSDQEEGNEYGTWTEDSLRLYACTIMGLLADIRQEAFTVVKKIKITGPGATFDLADDCDHVLSVVELSDADGNIITASQNFDADLARRMAGFPDPCGDDSYAPQYGYSMDASNPELITLAPPLDDGQELTATVNCVDYSSFGADPDKPLPAKLAVLAPAIREWILYSARMADDEIADHAVAQQHFSTFLALVPGASEALKLKAKSMQELARR